MSSSRHLSGLLQAVMVMPSSAQGSMANVLRAQAGKRLALRCAGASDGSSGAAAPGGRVLAAGMVGDQRASVWRPSLDC
jgi:hypothetical protein